MEPERPQLAVNGAQFRAWLEDIRTAQTRLNQEKTAWLRQLTPEQSRAIYLALWDAAAPHRDFTQPSEFLMRLQTVFQRMLNPDEPTRTSTP